MCGKEKLLCCSSMMGLCRIFRKLLNSGKLLSSLQLEVTEEIVRILKNVTICLKTGLRSGTPVFSVYKVMALP